MVRTWSRPYGLCHRLHTKAHIKGFGSPIFHVYACLLLCFMLVLASLILDFATLDALSRFLVAWLHLMPVRSCLDVTIWDASPWCRLLRACLSFFRSMRWYACHACLCHLLAFFASLHACSHVHAWVLLANVSSMLQHIEVVDIRSKPTFVPRGHLLLFAFLLCLFVCLPTFSFVCASFLSYLLPHAMLAMSIMFICFMPLLYVLFIFSFHCLSAGFLSLPLHVCMWSENAWI